MNKSIAIIAGEPNSISSEIIFKSWKLKNQFIHKPLFVIGSIRLLNIQMNKLKYNIITKRVNANFEKKIKKNTLLIYDVDYKQHKPFEKISNKRKFKTFNFDCAIPTRL